MPFNLNDFRNKFVHGGARPSQFEMQIAWPDAVRGAAGVSAAEADFRFLCQISEIPASTIGSIEVPYFGRKLKYAGDRTFATLTVTVLNDEDFKIRKAFEIWSQAVTAHQTTISQFDGGNVSGSYATDGLVIQHSRNSGGSQLHAYKFVGMFPTTLGAIALDWATVDEFEKFTVEFQYQYWLPVDGNTGQPVSANF
jgi:hypothetical protein